MARLTKSLITPDGIEHEFVGRTWYGISTTSATSTSKTVTINGFTSENLVTGVRVSVKFNNKNTASSITLNVSGTGAKTISGVRATNSIGTGNPDNYIRWSAGEVVDFVYDGTMWYAISADQNPYYYYCQTYDTTQNKIVTDSLSRFILTQGAEITVRFQYPQQYNGIPTLNVSSTGAKDIYRDSNTPAGQYEWKAGEIIDFVYDGTHWVIKDGGTATTLYYGKTKLSSDVAFFDSNATTAVTPSGVVANINYVATDCSWIGDYSSAPTTFFNGATPQASEWEDGHVFIVDNDMEAHSTLVGNDSSIKVLKITFGDYIIWYFLGIGSGYSYYFYLEYSNIFSIYTENDGYHIQIYDSSIPEGAYSLKIEYYSGNIVNGYVTAPVLEQYVKDKGFLTLADLPIYDGSVS